MIRVCRLLPVLLGLALLAGHALTANTAGIWGARTSGLTWAVTSAQAETAAAAADQKEIARQRQDIVDSILTTENAESVAQRRWVCFNGAEPSRVREARAGGFDFTPDASAICLATLQRKARDEALLEPYKKLVLTMNGNPDSSERLPKAMGAAVLSGDGKVSIGNDKGVVVDSALALDAGFTVAYTSAAAKKEGLDERKLRLGAEGCLDRKSDPGTCFSIGYALGSFAFNVR